MGKAARSKRDEKPAEKAEGDYEFKLPAFDEQSFIRRELLNAKASFYTLGLGLAAGVLSVALFLTPLPWYVGWLPIFAAMIGVKPFLVRLRFPEEVTSWKAMFGSYFMIFFTGLAIWILGVNLV